MLRFTLDVRRGELEFDRFSDAISAQLAGAREVEEALAALHGSRVKLQWLINDLSVNGYLAVELEPRVKKLPKKLPHDFAGQVTKHYVDQIRYVTAEHGVPPFLSMPTVERLDKAVADLDQHGVHTLQAVDTGSGEEVSFDENTREALRELVIPAWQAVGTVTGRIETVGRRPKPYANVYDDVTGRAIRCEFSESMQEQVLAAFNQRVVAQGMVSYDSQNRITRLNLLELEVLPRDDELPAARDMHGRYPDMRGDSNALFGEDK